MSVTVADLLTLPSLREAEVLGGRGGLSKIVSSISVLESTDPSLLSEGIFPKGEFFGSEIVITGFINMSNDVDCQYENMKRLSEGGEVGIILFYVGIYLQKVDRRLIELADEQDFVLICMPRKRLDLRYGEVLCDVWECIFRDRQRNESLVMEILDRVSRLAPHQRSMETVLKMLSDRLSASVVLMDFDRRIINLVSWPRSMEGQLKIGVETLSPLLSKEQPAACPFLPNSQMWSRTIHPDNGSLIHFLLIKEGQPLGMEEWEQATDVVSLSINIWGRQHGEVAVHELVRAILQDEPIKMRRLARIFHIEVEAIHEMWMFQGNCDTSGLLLQQNMETVQKMLQEISDLVVVDFYEDKLLVFLASPGSLTDVGNLISQLFTSVFSQDQTITMTRCSGLKDTSQVRRAYLCHERALGDVSIIFPFKRHYTLRELQFAMECRSLVEKGEEVLAECLASLTCFQEDKERENLIDTLKVYLLDGDSSVTLTSKLLYLHKNTIKYRIHRISQLLGFRPDKMPDGIPVYQAAAVHRLLH